MTTTTTEPDETPTTTAPTAPSTPTEPPLAPPPDQVEALRSTDVVDSLTGFDELAIEKAFGRTVEDLAEHSGATFLRALLFAHMRQRGTADVEAFKAVQSMRFADLKGRFKADDTDHDLPGSESGKESG